MCFEGKVLNVFFLFLPRLVFVHMYVLCPHVYLFCFLFLKKNLCFLLRGVCWVSETIMGVRSRHYATLSFPATGLSHVRSHVGLSDSFLCGLTLHLSSSNCEPQNYCQDFILLGYAVFPVCSACTILPPKNQPNKQNFSEVLERKVFLLGLISVSENVHFIVSRLMIIWTFTWSRK